jgi:hypothetical protein
MAKRRHDDKEDEASQQQSLADYKRARHERELRRRDPDWRAFVAWQWDQLRHCAEALSVCDETHCCWLPRELRLYVLTLLSRALLTRPIGITIREGVRRHHTKQTIDMSGGYDALVEALMAYAVTKVPNGDKRPFRIYDVRTGVFDQYGGCEQPLQDQKQFNRWIAHTNKVVDCTTSVSFRWTYCHQSELSWYQQ